jgi:hypothetical protein
MTEKNNKTFEMFKNAVIILTTIFLSVIVIFFTFFEYFFWGPDPDANKYSFSQDYSSWQTVTVQSVGSFQVPGDWVITQYDNIVFLTDKPIDEEDFTIYFAGVVYMHGEDVYPQNVFTSTFNNLSDNQVGSFAVYPFGFFSITHQEGWNGNNFHFSYDNGGSCYFSSYYIDSNMVRMYTIGVRGHPSSLYMVAWDGAVSESTVKKITASFSQLA